MKKEKQVRSYQRRAKSGKIVTVKAHTAKYDAAEMVKEALKNKKGAGGELEERKAKLSEMPNPNLPMNEYLDELKKRRQSAKKEVDEAAKDSSKTEKKTTKKVRPVGSGTNGPTPKRKSEAKVTKTTASKPATSEPAFTAAEFKEWYRGTGSAADKKVAKVLRAQLGRSGYRKLEDEAIDNYSSRGHLSMFKRVSGGDNTSIRTSKNSVTNKASSSAAKTPKTSTTGNDYSKITNKSLQRKITKYVQEATNWEHSKDARDYTWKDTLRALSDPGEKTVRSRVDKMISDGGSSASTTGTSVKKPVKKTAGSSDKVSSKTSSTTTSTTGAGADWSKATVDKIGREYGGGYTIVGTPNDRLWSSTNFRTKSQALDFIKRKQMISGSGTSKKTTTPKKVR